MSHLMTALAMQQKGLKPATKIVLYWLADHHNGETGACFPSLNTLAKECEMNRSTIVRHLDLLIDAKLIHREQRKRDNGSQTSTAYILDFTPVAKCNTPCCETQQPPVAKCDPHNLGNNNLGSEQLSLVPDIDLPITDPRRPVGTQISFDKHFEDFWSAYPARNGKKAGKAKAKAKFIALISGGLSIEVLASGVEALNRDVQYNGTWPKDAISWLNGSHWADEYGHSNPTSPRVQSSGGRGSAEIIKAAASGTTKKDWG